VKELEELKKVMTSELCTRCGSCVGLSNGKIEFTDREGRYLPIIKDELTYDEAVRINHACPGKNFSFPKYNSEFFPLASHFHSYTGSYESLYIGYAKNEKIRGNGASGGILTSVLLYLLEKKLIDGAIVTVMSDEKPWLTKTIIATHPDEIFASAQSKYIITSVNEILEESSNFQGKLAYVGLPAQVQSIRKLQSKKDPSVSNISYVLGPFYGNTLYFSSVRSFLRTYGERDYRLIKNLWFRHGEWPGNMKVEMVSGRSFELKKFHANYLIPFHILKNSLYCTDLSNEFTDISGGDAWAPVYEERGKGFSIVIGRSKKGNDLLNQMIQDGWLELNTLSEEEAISMHSHGYDLKKRGAFIRMKFRKKRGGEIPDFGYSLSDFPISRYLMEAVISSLFVVLGTRPARWMVEQLKPEFVGRIFEKTRNIWKKSTHSIKRKDLK
jgi:coenzyme F420 hydrogenase subunit beta